MAGNDWTGTLSWQADVIRTLWGPRPSRAAFASLARGNGKSFFLSALLAYFLLADKRARRLLLVLPVGSQGVNPVLADLARILRAAHGDRIRTRRDYRIAETGARPGVTWGDKVLTIVGAAARRLVGAKFDVALADEPIAWSGGVGKTASRIAAERAFGALVTSLGKMPGSRLLVVGTRSPDREHFFNRCLSAPPRSGRAMVWTAARRHGWDSGHAYLAANPSLRSGRFEHLRRAIRDEREWARKDPERKRGYEAYRLNRAVAAVTEQRLLPADVWTQTEGDSAGAVLTDPEPGFAVWGVDAATTGLAAVACARLAPDKWTLAVDAFGAVGGSPDLATRGQNEGVGTWYADCSARGELVTVGERVVDLAAMLREAVTRWGYPAAIVSDGYRRPAVIEAMQAAGIGAQAIRRRSGGEDGAQDTDTFRRWCLMGRVKRPANLLLSTAVAEARLVEVGRFRRLARGGEAGRRRHARDDAAAAAILAVSTLARNLG